MPGVLTKIQAANLFFTGAALCLFSPNPLLSVFALAALLVGIRATWQPMQPAVFAYGFAYQWMQAATRVIQANLEGAPVDEFDRSDHAESAIWIATTAVLLIARLLSGQIRRSPFDAEHLARALRSVSPYKVFQTQLFFLLITPLLGRLKIGGIAQFILPLENLHWFAFCLLTLAARYHNKGYGWLGIAFMIEFSIGLVGFFAGFKTVIIFLMIAVASSMAAVRLKHLIFILAGFFLLGTLGLFWTSIKEDYRMYLSGGQRAQAIVVSKQAQLTYLWNAAGNIDQTDWRRAGARMLDRLQYTKMLQLTMDHVPTFTPHTHGSLWFAAVRHILMPRFFFPDKAILDDSQNAGRYSGVAWAGASEGSSISLGYITESYVDFGWPWLLLPLIMLALLLRFLYAVMVKSGKNSPYIPLHFVGIILVFAPFSLIETSLAKLLGGVVMNFLVYHFFIRIFLFPRIWKFVTL